MILIFLFYFNTLSYDEKVTFERLFKQYSKYMYAIALNYHKNKFDAEDVVQEACIRLMKNINKIKDINSNHTKGFISVVTRNVAIDKYNDCKIEVPTDEEWIFDAEESFDSHVDSREELKYYLKKLKPQYLHTLILSEVYGYSSTEIASILGISNDNARKRKSRALKGLKDMIKEGDKKDVK